jgi:hypothetical protein
LAGSNRLHNFGTPIATDRQDPVTLRHGDPEAHDQTDPEAVIAETGRLWRCREPGSRLRPPPKLWIRSLDDPVATVVDLDITEAEALVRDALVQNGFGVLTEIDIVATFQTKLGIDRQHLKTLGACNAHFAHQGSRR